MSSCRRSLRGNMEESRRRAPGPMPQNHCSEVKGEYEVPERHQRPPERTTLEVGQRDPHGVHERSGSIREREALQPAADAQHDEVDAETDDVEPEVRRDELRVWPLPRHDARHDEV